MLTPGVIAGFSSGNWGLAGLSVNLVSLLLTAPLFNWLYGRRRYQVGVFLGVAMVGGAILMIRGSTSGFQAAAASLVLTIGVVRIVVLSLPECVAHDSGGT